MEDAPGSVFSDTGRHYEQLRLGKIITLGSYYPQMQVGAARALLHEDRAEYGSGGPDIERVQTGVEWTGTVNALNRGRRWAQRRCFSLLDTLLAPGIAVTVVPSHAAYVVDTPIRELARLLAASHDRVDATGCLERHEGIRQILFGGPSTRALHRQTIHILNPERIHGLRVLLLDDIAKSGASLVACRELLLEAGAAAAQPLALARVIVPER